MDLSDPQKALLPGLKPGEYHVSSPGTDDYNCFAWAAHVDDRWWQPSDDPRHFWPPGAPTTLEVESVIVAYELVGFERCANVTSELGYEKIAIYVNSSGLPSHAARQLQDGRWTSKLGEWPDIEHDSLEVLEGAFYGQVSSIMRRQITGS